MSFNMRSWLKDSDIIFGSVSNFGWT